MPSAAPKTCLRQGCKKVAAVKGYCSEHQTESRQYDRLRGSAHERGYTSVWRKARITYLSHRPLCKLCEDQDVITPATVVDHIVPHKGDQDLFWDTTNWQPLCEPCHNAKTASEDMGSWSAKKN